jgi:hypothetical protein
MVLRFGMGRDPEAIDEGATGRGILTTLVGDSAGFSRDVRDAQARAIGSILDEAYTGARRTLIAEMARLRDVAAYLYEQERIDGNEFEAVMEGRLRPADADDWRAAAASPRPWATIPTTFQERAPRVLAMPPPSPVAAAHSAPLPILAPAAEADPVPFPPAAGDPSSAPARRQGRRLIANRRMPAMPGRLRRSMAAIVRDLAADADR